MHKTKKEITIKDLLHPALTFKKNEKIDDIFRIMQERHETFSVILDKEEFVRSRRYCYTARKIPTNTVPRPPRAINWI